MLENVTVTIKPNYKLHELDYSDFRDEVVPGTNRTVCEYKVLIPTAPLPSIRSASPNTIPGVWVKVHGTTAYELVAQGWTIDYFACASGGKECYCAHIVATEMKY